MPVVVLDARGLVRDAHGRSVEVKLRTLDISKDGVVLAAEIFPRSAPVLVGSDDLVSEPISAENVVQHHSEVRVGVPVAMQVERASGLKDSVHLDSAFAHPARIDMDAALPAVLERPHLGLVSPNDLVEAVREEGRIEIDQVDAHLLAKEHGR